MYGLPGCIKRISELLQFSGNFEGFVGKNKLAIEVVTVFQGERTIYPRFKGAVKVKRLFKNPSIHKKNFPAVEVCWAIFPTHFRLAAALPISPIIPIVVG